MTISAELQWDEGSYTLTNNSSSLNLKYFVTSDQPNVDTRDTAMQWLFRNTPFQLYGRIRDSINLEELITDINNANVKEKIWGATVNYVHENEKEDPELQEQQVRISIRSGTGSNERLLYSSRLVDEAAVKGYKFKGTKAARLLNLKSDNDKENATMFVAEGINIPVGTVELVIETLQSNLTMTQGYLVNGALYAGQQRVNDQNWRGFPRGSVRLLNMDAKQRASDEGDTNQNNQPWEVTFTASYNPPTSLSELNGNLPPGLEGNKFTSGKEGWHYLDVLYVDQRVKLDGPVEFLIPLARRAAIHQIYDYLNFGFALRI